MKKYFIPLLLGGSTFLIVACTNESVDDLAGPPNTDPVTFVDDIRPIMQSNCTSCHGTVPTNGAPNSLVTFDEVRNSAQNSNLINRINNTGAPMPPSGLMPIPTRAVFDAWVNGGYQEN